MADSDRWMLEGFDRAADALKEEHMLPARSGRYWGDLFGGGRTICCSESGRSPRSSVSSLGGRRKRRRSNEW